KEAGYGGLCALPYGENLKPKYLTEAWFDMYRTCLEKARELGMTLILYDEYGWPSGTAGGTTRKGDNIARFKQKYPEHTSKYLRKIEYNTGKGSVFETELPHGQLMAAVAMDTLTYERIDLINHIAAGTLKWQSPGSGHWKVMLFSCVDAGNTIVDYLSPEAVGLYINMTHDEYYKRLSEYFGKTIISTFYDEISLLFAQNGRMWTPEFNQKFESKYGFSPALYYPALWYDIGAETAQARNYLYGFRTDLYAEGYPKLTSDWSVQHGISGTGHQDNEETMNCVGMSGDLMKCFKYLAVPGIDKIGGNRPAERFYKIISSAAHNWDHSLVMSETYGAMGNIGWDEIYGIAMDQYVKGINLLIPHAVWYNPENVVFKPELSSRNPLYADGLFAFNSYLARLNALLQNDASWTGDVAVLYPIETMQSGHYFDGPLGYYRGGVEIPGLDYVDVGAILSDSLGCDFMYLHPEILDEKCTIKKKSLFLNNTVQYNAFSVLIVPGCTTISLQNLEKIEKFVAAGGTVIFTTQLPRKGTRRTDDEKVQAIISRLFAVGREVGSAKNAGYKKGKAIFVKNPDKNNMDAALITSQTDFGIRFKSAQRVRNSLKILNGKHIWFFANPEAMSKNVEFELNGKYNLSVWDPHKGSISGLLEVGNAKKPTTVKLTLEGCHSLFLIEE
ncbi:MAG: hypothetical protein FWG22_01985, partial [Prolixibacteraceae bacterium]|nr:hypothetical protein [Prolixibacteraceae bacterium]